MGAGVFGPLIIVSSMTFRNIVILREWSPVPVIRSMNLLVLKCMFETVEGRNIATAENLLPLESCVDRSNFAACPPEVQCWGVCTLVPPP